MGFPLYVNYCFSLILLILSLSLSFFFFSLETESLYVTQAGMQWLFTGMTPLLISMGVLTCSISDLGQFTPP